MSDKTQSETEFLLNGVAFNADGECSRKPRCPCSLETETAHRRSLDRDMLCSAEVG